MVVPSSAMTDAINDRPQAMESDNLIDRYIEFRPRDHSPDRAQIVDTGVPVAALITSLRGSGGDIASTAREYDIPCDAVVAALVSFACHSDLINARIVLNNAAFAR